MNLTEFAHFFKRAVLVVVLIFAGYTGIKIIWALGKGALGITGRSGKPLSTELTKLPSPSIPSLTLSNESQPTFSLATVDEQLPEFPQTLPVFAVLPTPLTAEPAQILAQSLGFQGEGETLSETELIWKGNNSYQVLQLDTPTGNFTLRPNPILILSKLPRGQILSEEDAQGTAFSFLKSHGLLSEAEAATAQAKVLLLKFEKASFRGASGLKESQLARVDIFKTILVEETRYPILGTDPTESYLQVFVAPPSSVKTKTPIVNFTNWTPNLESNREYPLKTIETAWEEIKAGGGSVVQLNLESIDPYDSYQPLSISEIKIKEIRLAYLHPVNSAGHFQPVYVFKGITTTDQEETAAVTIYLPALTPEWLE